MPAVIAIDQGTTGSKAYRLDTQGRFDLLGSFEHKQIFPQAGWVEHDARELLDHLRRLAALAGDAEALGIDNQGETVIAWDAESGEPIHNAIVWQDARTQDRIERLKAEGAEALTIERAGLPLDPYFSASKLRWIIDHVPAAKPLLARGKLRLGTSDSFFLDRLAGVYATDVTTASRTSLMNLATGQWDPELCRLFGVPIEALAEIRPTVGDFGSAGRLPIRANLVDQQAALVRPWRPQGRPGQDHLRHRRLRARRRPSRYRPRCRRRHEPHHRLADRQLAHGLCDRRRRL